MLILLDKCYWKYLCAVFHPSPMLFQPIHFLVYLSLDSVLAEDLFSFVKLSHNFCFGCVVTIFYMALAGP